MYTTAVTSAAEASRTGIEPIKLRERIGSTTFEVSIRFSQTSKETFEDKILRLIGREVFADVN